MTMPMRPYSMGYGYGGGQITEQDYYGPQNPGHELAQAILASRAAKRSDEEASSLEEERRSIAAWRKAQADREAAMDPVDLATKRANLVRMGIRPPGQTATDMGGMTPVGGLSPAARMGGGDRFQVPPQSAHDLPGAFNPLTGTHNPAGHTPGDVDLGGGYTMGGAYTPEARQQEDITGLQGFGFTPDEALYLSHHPEHISGFMENRRGAQPYGGRSREQWMEDERFLHSFPSATEQDKPEISLAGALQEVDRLYGKNQPGGAAATLGADKRMALAQQMTRRGFNASRMPLTGVGDRNARFQARTGRALPGQAPDEEASDQASLERNRQLKAIQGMIPKGADRARVREILRQHGVSDEEAEGILNPPKPRMAAGAGAHF